MTFTRLLHPVEYSDGGGVAARQAVALARSYRADLHVVHALSRRGSADREAVALSRLRDFVEAKSVGAIELKAAIVYGDPVESVADYARSVTPDLVVVGRKGRRGSRLWRTGVFAKELASAIRCPTLVLGGERNSVSAEHLPAFMNILCPIDSSPAAAAASKLAVALAAIEGSRLTTFHVHDDIQFADGTSRDAAILSTTAKLDPDLIVIGLPIRGRFDAVFMRSTAALIVRTSTCAVLMVPPPVSSREPDALTGTLQFAGAS
jgi:nucleotide-binding universal stress UspA family protein